MFSAVSKLVPEVSLLTLGGGEIDTLTSVAIELRLAPT